MWYIIANICTERTKKVKKFNVNGVCNPNKHYMVDISEKIARITEMIDHEDYFTINRARQYGKSTTLALLEQSLGNKYTVVRISFEGYGDMVFSDQGIFIVEFIRDIADRLSRQGTADEVIAEWTAPCIPVSFKSLSRKITNLCETTEKPVILMIDEVDKTSNNQLFLDFLSMLRSKYLERAVSGESTFRSVILAGVYDIKNIKLKLRADEQRSFNSPWNIAASFNVDMSFSPDEIITMLTAYECDHQTGMDTAEISNEIYSCTSGYPYLVSNICRLIDEQFGRDWTVSGVHRAIGEILREKTPLFENIIKILEDYSGLNAIMKAILLSGDTILYNIENRYIDLGVTFGLFKRDTRNVEFYNTIFETRIYNYMISMTDHKRILFGDNKYVKSGRLNMEQVLKKFQELMRSEYRSSDGAFIEKQGRLLFLCFLKPIINGTGHYAVEAETRDNTRMDIQVFYGGEEYIIELKIWHGDKMNEAARDQLYEYLDNRHQGKGYLVSFCFNKDKQYTAEWTKIGDKDIFEIVV